MRRIFRGAFLALLLCGLTSSADPAKEHYRLGKAAEKRGANLEAYSFYVQARAADPENRKYAQAAARLRNATARAIAISTAGTLDELPPSEPVPILDLPEDPLKDALGATALEPDDHVASFSIDASIEDVYRRVCEEYGLDVLFDEGFRSTDQVQFRIDDVRFDDAMIALNEVAVAFVVPLTPKLVLVAEDTPGKRSELEPVVTIDVPIPEAVTPEEATEVSQAVQQTLDVRRLFAVPSRNIVTIRDSPAKARIARLLLERLMVPTAEVMLEVEFIAYNRDRDATYGTTLPGVFTVTNYSTTVNAVPPDFDGSPQIGIGGGETLFGIGVVDAAITATLRASTGSGVQQVSLRAMDGTEAQIRIGERFPIITASFLPGSGQDPIDPDPDFVVPPPSFTFEDLGLNIVATPTVHGSREVTLQMQAEFNLLAGISVNGIPVLVSRTLETHVRLREGEAALIAGMAIDETRQTRSTPLGLTGIPVISDILARNTRQRNGTDLLILVRPRLVRLPASELVKELNIRFGTEERPLQAL